MHVGVEGWEAGGDGRAARWGLERAGIDYREEPHLQGFHVWCAKRAGGGFTVPVLVLLDGRAIAQSSEILQWTNSRIT